MLWNQFSYEAKTADSLYMFKKLYYALAGSRLSS